MAPEDVAAVLARNSVASLIQDLDSGRVRTRRVRYVFTPGALYLRVSRRARWFRRDPPPAIECHVSELDGLQEWRYVWARGAVTRLEPSYGILRVEIQTLDGVTIRLA